MLVPFKLEQDKLYDLVYAGEEIGKITKEASRLTGIPEGLPLIASGSDKGCETLGVGAINEDVASVSFGTTATIQLSTKNILNLFCLFLHIQQFIEIDIIQNLLCIEDIGHLLGLLKNL